ncbi:MAG: N-acetylmuramoyl-L-alanine amidase [Defluviitaleaceae bacterium]|nr:N-acetylmuramoyl-L-alanine amidase [Defluviitaleaceae bacterium]
MKKRTYQILAALVLLAALFVASALTVAAARPVNLNVNGNMMAWQYQEPIRVDGRVFVPFREFTESLGGYVGWHSGHRQASLFYGNHVLVLTIGSNIARLNGYNIPLDYPPFLLNGRTMIPLRFVSEAFGYNVGWETSSNTAFVMFPGAGHTTAPPASNTGDLPFIPLPPNPPAQTTPPATTTAATTAPVTPAPTLPLATTAATAPNNNSDTAFIRNISRAPIPFENHPETTIVALRTPADTNSLSYIVEARSAITSVTYFVLDNRLIVDIHRSISTLVGPFYVPNGLFVSELRYSQFSRDPNVTRLVFHVTDALDFSLSLSNDRRFLTIEFHQKFITNLALHTNMGVDALIIGGNQSPTLSYTMDAANRRLIVDSDSALLLYSGVTINDATFVSRVTTGTRANGLAFMHVYFACGISLPRVGSFTNRDNSTMLMFYHAINGITYVPERRALRICRANGFTMNTAQVQHRDEYLLNRYTLTLPSLSVPLAQGIAPAGDGFVNSFIITRDAQGVTHIVFDTARVVRFVVEETPTAYYIIARLPREMYSMVVVIDPGHGGNDPGVTRNGVHEANLVLTVAQKLTSLLNQHDNIAVYQTRHGNTNSSMLWRAQFAECVGDIFISIHANGFSNPAVHGIETHYTISDGEAGLAFNSRNLAQIVQRNMIVTTSAHNRGLFRSPQFPVIREANTTPAVIAEIGFFTNTAEFTRLTTANYQWQIARGLYNAILEAHGIIGR